MTTHTPLRCANSVMEQRGTHEVVLLDTGNYPSYSSFLNETWTWNGTDWTHVGATLMDANGPLPGRSQMTMAYDGYNMTLFGGQGAGSGQIFNDTWSWNGTTWTKESPATSPFGRFGAKAAYLSTVGLVMFGGFGGAGNGVYLNETWIYNGTTWSLVSVPNTATGAPSARVGHCLAASNTTLIMFGGSVSSGEIKNSTWSFNGTAWTKLNPATSPSARAGAAMAYDTANSKWVVFGGMNEYNYLPETWTFDGTTWTQVHTATVPAGRVGAQMCYDSQSGTVLMYGGISGGTNYPSNETWSFNGTNWTKL